MVWFGLNLVSSCGSQSPQGIGILQHAFWANVEPSLGGLELCISNKSAQQYWCCLSGKHTWMTLAFSLHNNLPVIIHAGFCIKHSRKNPGEHFVLCTGNTSDYITAKRDQISQLTALAVMASQLPLCRGPAHPATR